MLSFTREQEGLLKPEASLAVSETAGGLEARGHRPEWGRHLLCLSLGTKARLSNPGKAEERKWQKKVNKPIQMAATSNKTR